MSRPVRFRVDPQAMIGIADNIVPLPNEPFSVDDRPQLLFCNDGCLVLVSHRGHEAHEDGYATASVVEVANGVPDAQHRLVTVEELLVILDAHGGIDIFRTFSWRAPSSHPKAP